MHLPSKDLEKLLVDKHNVVCGAICDLLQRKDVVLPTLQVDQKEKRRRYGKEEDDDHDDDNDDDDDDDDDDDEERKKILKNENFLNLLFVYLPRSPCLRVLVILVSLFLSSSSSSFFFARQGLFNASRVADVHDVATPANPAGNSRPAESLGGAAVGRDHQSFVPRPQGDRQAEWELRVKPIRR